MESSLDGTAEAVLVSISGFTVDAASVDWMRRAFVVAVRTASKDG